MKKLFNKKGYTMTYAIIVIGLLLILTGSVTFISYYNLKTARIGGHVNTSFYANDGAIEEALTELNQYTYNAEVKAWERIDDHSFVVDDSKWVDFLTRIYQDVNNGTDGFTIEKGNELIALALKGEFETTFFNELYNGQQATHPFYNPSGITLSERYLDYNGYTGITLTSKPTLQPFIVSKLTENDFTADHIVSPDDIQPMTISHFKTVDEKSDGTLVDGSNGFTLTIKSDGTYHKYQKELEVNLHVVAPDYEFSVAMLTENIVMYGNDLANYALVANDNLVVLDGPVFVDGDVYAYGNYLSADKSSYGHVDVHYNLPRDHYGGVVIGYRRAPSGSDVRVYGSSVVDNFAKGSTRLYESDTVGQLTVSGNVASRNSIKIDVSKAKGNDVVPKNSYLKVSQDVYANSIYIRPDTIDAELIVGDDLMMYADLFVSGENASIQLGRAETAPSISENRSTYQPSTGELWGLHDINLAAGELYTRTGSIIISREAVSPSILANGIYLNGVVRYDVEGKGLRTPQESDPVVSYKTGESLTTYKNAIYYQSLLTDDIYQNGVFAFLSGFGKAGNLYDLISFSLDPTSTVKLDQVDYRSNHFYTMGYFASTDDDNIYKKVADADKNILKIRQAVVDSNNQFLGVHALGIVAFENVADGSGKGKVYNINKTDYNFDNTIKNNLLVGGVDKSINLLGFTYEKSDGTYREENLFAQWLDVMINDEDGDDSNDVLRKSVPLTSMTSTAIGLYNNDPTKDVYINFPASYFGSDGLPKDDHIYIKGNGGNTLNLEGTIVSRGNVYVYADAGEVVNYKGNIISEKTIYLFGAGIKNLEHDKQVIYELIHNNDGDENDPSDDGLSGLYFATYGRTVVATANSVSKGFALSLTNNQTDSNRITLNYVSSADPNGTNIIDSNSVKIDSWVETD